MAFHELPFSGVEALCIMSGHVLFSSLQHYQVDGAIISSAVQVVKKAIMCQLS